MKTKYEIAFWIKPLVFGFILVLLVCLPNMSIEMIKNPQGLEIALLVLTLVLLVFFGYLIKTIFDILKDEYKNIAVNIESEALVLTHKKLGIKQLHFNDIQIVKCIKGEILRGIPLGHITIIDKQGAIYGLTISKIDSFYMNLSNRLPMSMDERLFFGTK